jgi:two-component system chemotaxis response regulator CheY
MGAAKRILVVDDSASVRRELREGMERAGFVVVEADNGERGLEVLEEPTPVDAMIVDVNMPVMDGVEMIRRTRAMRRFASTPIFVLTTESGTASVKEGKAAGATAWIVKPVRMDLLVAGMRKVLGI